MGVNKCQDHHLSTQSKKTNFYSSWEEGSKLVGVEPYRFQELPVQSTMIEGKGTMKGEIRLYNWGKCYEKEGGKF